MSMPEYLGRAQHIVEDLALAGRPMTLSEQNLYVFRGLRPEFRSMAASLAVNGTPMTIPQLADCLQAQQFIHADDFPTPATGDPVAMYAGSGRRNHGDGNQRSGQRGGGSRGAGGRGGGNGRGGRGRGNGRGPVRCQICRAQGHSAAYFHRRYSEPPPSQAHMAVTADGGSHNQATAWLPDTGATTHATPDPGLLSQSEDYHGDDVLRMGNGAGLDISSVGHAVIPSGSKSLKLIETVPLSSTATCLVGMKIHRAINIDFNHAIRRFPPQLTFEDFVIH
ncbi:PREDICTED: uncharacterized protein LOC109167865 [Ipomoea nil]|uniref:uncharacterized protein LOC109167865 n=1 Tax=Ipomoea nil TaxID=35883 RepID=UPI0009009533|nr:PREDICTED: uncharacterized protein LOC109167865 [Ipomoea nil]